MVVNGWWYREMRKREGNGADKAKDSNIQQDKVGEAINRLIKNEAKWREWLDEEKPRTNQQANNSPTAETVQVSGINHHSL